MSQQKIRADLIGQVFGRLTVLSFVALTKKKEAIWICNCACGGKAQTTTNALLSGHARSCGCLRHFPHDIDAARLWRQNPSVLALQDKFKRYQRNAKARKHPFSLTFEQFILLASRACHYCGSKPATLHRMSPHSTLACVYNGLDRVNNSEGYHVNNVVPCCSMCNYMKGKMSPEEFIHHCEQIVARQRFPESDSPA